MFQAFSSAYSPDEIGQVFLQQPDDKFVALAVDPNEAVDLSYRPFFLYVMRNLSRLDPVSTLLEPHERRQTAQEDPNVLYEFATFAHHLGLRTPQLSKVLSEHPSRDQLDACIEHVCDYLAEAQRAVRSNDVTPLHAGPDEALKRRSGKVYRRAHYESSRHPYLINMHQLDMRSFNHVNAFVVRRSIYLSFFGCLENETSILAAQDETLQPNLDLDMIVRSSLIDNSQIELSVSEVADDAMREVSSDIFTPDDYWTSTSHPDVNDIVDLYRESSVQDFELREMSQDDAEHEKGTQDSSIRFISLQNDVVQVVASVSENNANPRIIEQMAESYATKGFFLFTADLKSLSPSQCFQAAVEDENKLVVLLTEDDLQIDERRRQLVTTICLHNPKRKRVDHVNDRPYKYRIIG
ncbi:hypothetical protein BJ878DRAFT_568106 [Calycina marina]|uniref:Uncharacterized protein n=1 Tax=Calycina marina TaxID=1763456 RepID=A0A9P7Z228_9HELO|nr:hypothetical protein BJ878DRAFT_568106 [Calycina marina]